MINFYRKQLKTTSVILLLYTALSAQQDPVDSGSDMLRHAISRERTEKITAASLPSYQLIEKIKFFLEQHTLGDRDELDYFESQAALSLVERAQWLLKKAVAGFNRGIIHNLSVEYKFLQVYNSEIPIDVQPRNLRLFSEKIIEFDQFINDFVKKKRTSLTIDELSLIDKVMQLNYLLTKGLLRSDYLDIGTLDYAVDQLVYKPWEFAVNHKKSIFFAIVVLGVAGASYYFAYPEFVRWVIHVKRNKDNNDYRQFVGLCQNTDADSGYCAVLNMAALLQANGNEENIEKIVEAIKPHKNIILQDMKVVIKNHRGNNNNEEGWLNDEEVRHLVNHLPNNSLKLAGIFSENFNIDGITVINNLNLEDDHLNQYVIFPQQAGEHAHWLAAQVKPGGENIPARALLLNSVHRNVTDCPTVQRVLAPYFPAVEE